MPCSQFTDALTRYAAGNTITPAVAAHLETCQGCCAYLEAERGTLAIVDAELRQALSIDPAPHLAARLHARAVSTPPASRGWWWIPALAAAAVLALVVWTSFQWSVVPTPDAASEADAGLRPLATPPTPAPSPSKSREAVNSVQGESAGSVQSTLRESVKSVAHPSVKFVGSQPAKSVEPEVLVPSDQRVAIRRLMTSLREGRIDGTILSAPSTDESTTALAPLDLQITPLTIDLLSVGAPDLAAPPSMPPDAAAR